jgi:uncharacterized protein (TIGR03437 family)
MANAIRSKFLAARLRVLVLLFGAVASSTAQPVIPTGGVVNAGSYATPGQAHYGVAQGSIFAVFGTGLGPASAVQASQFPLAGSQGLAGTSVRVTVAGVSKDAFMLYAWANQVLAILPSDTPTGDGVVTVTYLGQTSGPSTVRVIPGSFGIFTRSQNGRGRAILQNVQPNSDLAVNDLTESAHPGQTVILWGTGLGAVSGDESAGPLPGANFNPQIYVGGQFVKALYAGRSGCCAGVDQISFIIPDGVAGCYVPVAVGNGAAGSNLVVGNYATISIAQTGNACADSGLGSDALAKFGTGATPTVASAVLSRNFGNDDGIVSFLPFNPDRTFSAGSLVGLPPAGSCHVLHLNTDPAGNPSPASSPFPVPSPTLIPLVVPDSSYFDAGPSLSLNGPLGSRQLMPVGLSPYVAAFSTSTSSSYLASGTYTLDNGSGGKDIGGFRATIGFSPTLTWTNRPPGDNTQISRQSPLAITWAGGDPQHEWVMINGTLSMQSLSSPSRGLTATGFFTCVERVDAGQFNVPSFVLYGLPVDTGVPFLAGGPTSNAGAIYASLSVSSISRLDQNMFLAPGLDAGYFAWLNADSVYVSFNF